MFEYSTSHKTEPDVVIQIHRTDISGACWTLARTEQALARSTGRCGSPRMCAYWLEDAGVRRIYDSTTARAEWEVLAGRPSCRIDHWLVDRRLRVQLDADSLEERESIEATPPRLRKCLGRGLYRQSVRRCPRSDGGAVVRSLVLHSLVAIDDKTKVMSAYIGKRTVHFTPLIGVL
ncbi:hypothetical protein AB0H98_27900 [Nocardia salmonicida]|uniref:hypothetical protein n=1 Tax=Nocardia salmonicida TaxID=53431 RepID=UPI0033F33794